MEKISIKTNKRIEAVDITDEVQKKIEESNIDNGICFLYVPHTTAAIVINESYDESVSADILEFLSKLVPKNGNYKHAEGNSDAHIKSALIGNSLFVAVEKGKLCLGRWQGILFLEFDGPRSREVWIRVVKV